MLNTFLRRKSLNLSDRQFNFPIQKKSAALNKFGVFFFCPHDIKESLYFKYMKPLIKWSGGKADEIDEIMKYAPENYDTYVEPFVGGGALFFHLAPQKSVINDIHPDLINLYSEIKNGNGDQIWNLMDASEFTEEEYYKIRDSRTLATPIEKAFQFY